MAENGILEFQGTEKVIFRGSESNIVIDTTKSSFGVGVVTPTSNLHVVGRTNLDGQLELTGDSTIQEYPPRALTGYETLVEGHGVFTASASTWVATTYEPYFAFDNNNSTAWLSGPVYDGTNGSYTGSVTTGNIDGSGTLSGEWLQISLPSKIFLKRSGWIPQSVTRGPKTGVILGSNNGSDWNTIHSFSGKTYSGTTETELFSGTSSIAYQHFRIIGSTIEAGARLEGREWKLFGTPGPTTLDKGSLTLGRSLDVPRVSRYDVDTETPRPEKLVVDFDTTVNSSPTDISGQGNHGTFNGAATYSPADKAFDIAGTPNGANAPSTSAYIDVGERLPFSGNQTHTFSLWFKKNNAGVDYTLVNIWKEGTNYVTGGHSSGILVLSSGKYLFWTFGGQITYTDPEGDTSYGGWRHIVAVYTGPTVADQKFYVNGVEANAVSGSPDSVGLTQTRDLTNAKMTIGKDHYRGAYYNQANTEFSAIKVYNVALEPSEVQKLYNLGRTGRSMVISDTAVGIGKVPEAQLDVRGNLNVSSFVKYDSAWFYAYDGNTNGTGDFNDYTGFVPWASLEPGSKHFTTASASTSGGYYTAPVDGIYHFDTSVLNYPNARSGITGIHFAINDRTDGTNFSSGYNRKTDMPGQENVNASLTTKLNGGDTVKVYVNNIDCYTESNHAFFSGYLVTRI